MGDITLCGQLHSAGADNEYHTAVSPQMKSHLGFHLANLLHALAHHALASALS
jgi:hypothetical protein